MHDRFETNVHENKPGSNPSEQVNNDRVGGTNAATREGGTATERERATSNEKDYERGTNNSNLNVSGSEAKPTILVVPVERAKPIAPPAKPKRGNPDARGGTGGSNRH